MDVSSSNLEFAESPQFVTDWGAANRVQAAFRVCAGVRFGRRALSLVFRSAEQLLVKLEIIRAFGYLD